MYAETITAGIIVSLIFSELTGLSASGLIVPGYIVLSLSSPLKILWTLAVSLLTLGVYRIISRFTILYGRRRFALMIIISVSLGWLLKLVPVGFVNISVIGYLIPGIISREMDRQGILKTLASTALVTLVTAMICMLLGVKLL